MKFRVLAGSLLACAAAIASAQQTSAPATTAAPRSQPFSLADLTSKLDMVESLGDLTSWIGKRPEPSPEFSYTEKRAFDMQLHESLKAAIPTVNVQVSGAFTRDRVPERLSQWLNAVQKSGGAVRYCAMEPSDRSLFSLLGVVLQLGKKVDKWMLYRPAANYDALLVTDASQGKVLNAVFTERGAVKNCPEGTREVSSGAVNGAS